jgi:prepilin-type N-terminal cleavage/methylation domain-containing protein
MKFCPQTRGLTLVELMITTVLIGALGLIIYSLLNIGMILGAKNTAVNTAHQQARTAMLQMVQDLHSAVSLPQLVDANGNPMPTPAVGASPTPAAGIQFQEWSAGPYRIYADALTTQNYIQIAIPSAAPAPPPYPAPPAIGQGLIVPTHQIEADISAVASSSGAPSGYTGYKVTLKNFRDSPMPNNNNLPVAIQGTTSTTGDIICFITDRCSYTVVNSVLQWKKPASGSAFSVMGSDITNSTPFNTPTTAAGALYYRFVSAIQLSTSDLQYNNRGFKSANIMLNGQVPAKARLTTYQ